MTTETRRREGLLIPPFPLRSQWQRGLPCDSANYLYRIIPPVSLLDEPDAESIHFDPAFFPFPPDFSQSVRAQLEFFAQSPQYARFLAVRVILELACDEVRPFSLGTIIDEAILACRRPHPGNRLGINARPEEGEIADMPVDFPRRSAFGRQVGDFRRDVRHLIQSSARGIAQPVKNVHVDEPAQQSREVIDQIRGQPLPTASGR